MGLDREFVDMMEQLGYQVVDFDDPQNSEEDVLEAVNEVLDEVYEDFEEGVADHAVIVSLKDGVVTHVYSTGADVDDEYITSRVATALYDAGDFVTSDAAELQELDG